MTTLNKDLSAYIKENIVTLINSFRLSQSSSGEVKSEQISSSKDLLKKILLDSKLVFQELKLINHYDALEKDINEWVKSGLNTKPDFKNIQNEYLPPADGDYSFFIGPVKCQNGPTPRGYFLECFLVKREEQITDFITEHFPHPKNRCQAVRLIIGSNGISTGNCVVFFPENISSTLKIQTQNYAMFFFNKFKNIYMNRTIPIVNNVVGPLDIFRGINKWQSSMLDSSSFYKARCIWGYLHDYYHHQGIRPFDEHIQLKLNWFVGLLEETKVDCETILACHNEKNIPYSEEVIQFVLFERLFRYPLQNDAETNFDSGTGFFLFQWLLRHNVLDIKDGNVILNETLLMESLLSLVETITNIEKLYDDKKVIEEAMELVSKYIRAERINKKVIIEIPDFYKRLKLTNRFESELVFDAIDY